MCLIPPRLWESAAGYIYPGVLACDSRGVGAGFVLLRPDDGISGEGEGGKAAMKLVVGSDVNQSARAKGIEK